MTTTSKDWAEWLENHRSAKTYDAHPEEVRDLCSSTSPKVNFTSLVTSKNIVLLTKSSVGTKVQATFSHSTVGIPILPDTIHNVARVGMRTGVGMEVDVDSLFQITSSTHYKPDLLSLMKTTSPDEIGNLAGNEGRAKRKIKCYATLTPALAKVIEATDMSPTATYVATIAHIKAVAPPAPPDAADETADGLLERIGAPYEQLLLFLWMCVIKTADVKSPNMAALSDQESLEWEQQSRQECFPETQTSTITSPTVAPQGNFSTGAITAMTKLSTCMIEQQKAVIKSQEDKSDSRLKAWKRLPKLQQNVILLGGIDDQLVVPTSLTEEMYSILGCQNGAQVEQYIQQSMQGHNIALEPGFCTALNKGMMFCNVDAGSPKNFTIFLTPPMKDEVENQSSANLLKMAVQEKFDSSDLHLLTKMEISIPTKTNDLRHQVKNYTGCAGRCFGADSLIYRNLSSILNHIENNETCYDYEFKEEKMFGGDFLEKINWRVQKFLQSCADGDEAKIKTEHLEFHDILERIERREYHTKVPRWISNLVKKREKKPDQPENVNGGGKQQFKRRKFDAEEKDKRVSNPDSVEGCRLAKDEKFRDVFNPGNVQNMEKPTTQDGQMICFRYHTLGFCFGDCKRYHGALTNNYTSKLKEYVKKARENRKAYLNRRRNGNTTNKTNGSEDNTNSTPGEQLD